jgi:hypothetical protein
VQITGNEDGSQQELTERPGGEPKLFLRTRSRKRLVRRGLERCCLAGWGIMSESKVQGRASCQSLEDDPSCTDRPARMGDDDVVADNHAELCLGWAMKRREGVTCTNSFPTRGAYERRAPSPDGSRSHNRKAARLGCRRGGQLVDRHRRAASADVHQTERSACWSMEPSPVCSFACSPVTTL